MSCKRCIMCCCMCALPPPPSDVHTCEWTSSAIQCWLQVRFQSASALLWSNQDLVRLRLMHAAVVESWSQTLYLPVGMQLLLKAGDVAGDCSLGQAFCIGSCDAQSSSCINSPKPFILIPIVRKPLVIQGYIQWLFLRCCFKLVILQLSPMFSTCRAWCG